MYFSDNSLLIEDQFAYIKHQSTVNALHTLIDNTLCNINDGLITGIVQLDLRKGFDTINHYILLYKLEKYGINDNCLSWFKSYLSNRQQVVSLVMVNCLNSVLYPLVFPRVQYWVQHYLLFTLMILVLIWVLFL